MNWIRENKFLSGFLAAVIVGVGVFGYLLYSAMGSHDEISARYDQQASELHRLQALAPYPDEANIQKIREQKQSVSDAATALRTSLTPMQFSEQPMTPEGFQDSLRKAVTTMVEKAKGLGVTLPKDQFYMGFNEYQATLPRPEAAAALGRQLQAIEFVVNTLVENRVDSINAIRRTPLPEEGLAAGGTGPATAGVAGGVKPGVTGKPGVGGKSDQLVSKVPFEIEFTSDQPKFRKSINDIVSSTKQFYIIRTLVVKNQAQAGPPRAEPTPPGGVPAPADAGAAPAPTPSIDAGTGAAAATGTPSASPSPAAASPLRFVLGTEKLDVGMRLDIVAFAPAATPTPAPKGNSAPKK